MPSLPTGFPHFLWPFDRTGDSPAYNSEPVSLSFDDALHLWWAMRTMSVNFSVQASYDGDTRTISGTVSAARRNLGDTADMPNTIDGMKDLLKPGPGFDGPFVNSAGLFYYSGVGSIGSNWGGSDGDHPELENYCLISASGQLFHRAVFTGIRTRRFGWSGSIAGSVSPCMDLQVTLSFIRTSSGADPAPSLNWTSLQPTSGSYVPFTATYFGTSGTAYRAAAVGGITFDTVASDSLTFTNATEFSP